MMTQEQIYQLAIKMAMEADLRGKTAVQKVIKRSAESYKKLDKEEKEFFDTDALFNPYPDSRILVPTKKQIKKVLVGIDISVSELWLADKLGDIDLVISHHPLGKALAGLDSVMHMQADILADYGIPINIAESLLKVRIDEVSRSISAANHNRVIDAANLLNRGLMCCHTLCDNLVARFLQEKIEKENIEYVSELIDLLKKIPEYREATKLGVGPKVFAGRPENRAGKIGLLEITGGTEGSEKIYDYLARAGVGTTVGMHISEKNKKEAEAAHLNVVIAGHISSDSLGVNLFLDELEKRGVEIVPCSGLIRVSRIAKNKKK
jgi:putative NIF3 family GTP cyclohydrolase 1 type 2